MMTRTKRFVGMLFLFSLTLFFLTASVIKGEEMFKENFQDSEAAFQRFDLLPSDWEVKDGVLKTKGTTTRSVSFTISEDENLSDFELEFKVKRLEINPSDQHFGIRLRESDEGTLMLYCRGDGIIFLETVNKQETRHALAGKFLEPLEVGEKAKWSVLKMVCKGNKVTIYKDGLLVSSVEGVAPKRGKVSFYAYNLDLLLDYINLIPLESKDQAKGDQLQTESKNIVPNSSFEYCTEPGLPDYWGCPHWGMLDPYWVVHFEEWHNNFGVDGTTSFEGKRSMRINNPFDKPNEEPWHSALCLRSCFLGATPNEYTLSAYLKGEPEGMKVNFTGQEIILTKNWQRYSTTFIMPIGGNPVYGDMINIYPLIKGTFWVDAVQLEEGKEVTPYGSSPKDALLSSLFEKEKGVGLKVPQFKPKKGTEEVLLDGKLNEPCWARSEKLSFLTYNGEKPIEPTEARLFYNEEGIYIGIKCQEEAAGKNVCKWTERDGNVWADPSIEIFISPQHNQYYYHLAFNQKGIQYDAANADCSWDGLWKVATNTGDGFWSAEVFLPFGNFNIDPTMSNWWGFNLCRENHSRQEYSCWSPTYGGFHTPERFGRVCFDTETLSNYYLSCQNISGRFISDQEISLATKVRNDSQKEIKANLQVSIKGDNNKEINFEKEVYLAKGQEMLIPLGNLKYTGEKYRTRISFLSTEKKTLLYTITTPLDISPLFEFKTQYSLYTKEKDLLLEARFGLSPEKLRNAKCIFEIKDAQGTVCLKREIGELNPKMEVQLPLESLADGKYVLTGQLMENNGKIIAKSEEPFLKSPPKPYEVKIDKLCRMATVDGKPYIPFGFSWEGDLTYEIMEYLVQNGFTFVATGINKSLLDNAAKAGLKVKVNANVPDKELKEMVEQLKEHPAVLAWDIFDEIFTCQWGKENYQVVEDTCQKIQELDPYHPVYINENEFGLTYLKSKNLPFPGAIVSIDYYPYPPSGNIPITADYVKTMEEMGRKEGKPAWIYPFGGGYAFPASRELTPPEQEFYTYTALINGVTGFMYFASHPRSKSNWKKIKEMNQEIKYLTPIIASREEIPVVKCSSPSVQILAKSFNRKLYLITVNSSKEPVTGRFNIPELKAGKESIRVLFENRTLNYTGEFFEDTFAGYQRHVYEIER